MASWYKNATLKKGAFVHYGFSMNTLYQKIRFLSIELENFFVKFNSKIKIS